MMFSSFLPLLIYEINLLFFADGFRGPIASPFFFLCQYHGQIEQSNIRHGEISLSISLAGNPEYYEPGKTYEVSVNSNLDFDGFLLTGLYTVPQSSSPLPGLNPIMSTFGHGVMCSVVHSHLSSIPSKRISFLWIAPPSGTGCIDFLATASLGQEIIFKDTLVLQICEEGVSGIPVQLSLTGLHQAGLILRENFDSSNSLDKNLWSKISGGAVDDSCGTIVHGNAATFCNLKTSRYFVSNPLNTSTASVVQFAFSAGTCGNASSDPKVNLFYGSQGCTHWSLLENLHLPPTGQTVIHIVSLPKEAKTENVCLKWEQEGKSSYEGCWALDNILVLNAAERPSFIGEDFDPVDPSNWLFFPGAEIKKRCHSDGNALLFKNHHKESYAVTRDMNLLLEASPDDIIFKEDFETDLSPNWILKDGEISYKCGIVHSKKAVVFHGNGIQKICTPYLNATHVGTVRFVLSADCNSTHRNSKLNISIYAELNTGEKINLEKKLKINYEFPTLYAIPVPHKAQTFKTRFCWHQNRSFKQTSHQSWAVDNIHMLPWQPETISYVLQFRANLKCSNNNKFNNSLKVEFSNNQGHVWHPLHSFCLPGFCKGAHHAVKSEFLHYDFDRWARITLPLPYSALTESVRFRFKQHKGDEWALDDVYIGECQDGCNGHGSCQQRQCKCDLGYQGESCRIPVLDHPAFLSETFSAPLLQPNRNILKIQGGNLSYQCGVLSSGRAVVFHKGGLRELIIRELNTTQAKFLELSIRIGSWSDTSDCPSPDHPSESIFIHFSCNGGLTWKLLSHLQYNRFKDPQHLSIPLPDSSKQTACQFRIWQPYHSGEGNDVWAIDDITVTSILYNLVNLNFSDETNVNHSVRYHLGRIKDYCGHDSTLRFINENKKTVGGMRFLESKSLNIGPSFMIQFDLIMGCSNSFSVGLDNKIYLEYSTNHGLTWQLVQKPCLPPNGNCNRQFTQGTIYDSTEFSEWKRITLSLPSPTWSSATRFRFRQSMFSDSDEWAIDNFYIGQECPDLCNGHGYCSNGICLCDTGFHGKTCIPMQKLKQNIRYDFDSSGNLTENGLTMEGGSVVKNKNGCGVITSGSSLYFHENGIRQLITDDLNTSAVDFVKFFIRIGGGDPKTCNNATNRNESVLLQFSKDAGITWKLMKELHYENYREPKYEIIELPKGAKSSCTRIRWWQPQHSGKGHDQWALDELNIDHWKDNSVLQTNFDNATNISEAGGMWCSLTKADFKHYCGSKHKVLVFDGPENIRFAMTKELWLQEGDVIQFKINIGCSTLFLWKSPVKLEYLTNSHPHWKNVQEKCYSESDCKDIRHESSVYHQGPFGQWTTVTIPVSKEMSNKRITLRWKQIVDSFSYSSDFALDQVYIGPPCPNMCSGHGLCSFGTCICDDDYEGTTCLPVAPRPAIMVDRFDGSTQHEFWSSIFGGKLSFGCDFLAEEETLYFSEEGTREATTVELDTRFIKMIQFSIQIGSKSNSNECQMPKSHNESVIIQYSMDNGISWHILLELKSDLFYQNAKTVYIKLPQEAKTPITRFRWWQPLGDEPQSLNEKRAQWTLDDLIIAANETSASTFYDNFDPMQFKNWYKIQHGEPRITCNKPDFSLEFKSSHYDQYFAETWDFEITPATFLQFDISLGCTQSSDELEIYLEFSLDMGRTWDLVVEDCFPSDLGCNGYHTGSVYETDSYSNWTRVTINLPSYVVSPTTRFRWIQKSYSASGSSWALDNIYLGSDCPWLCSGHGYCSQGHCVCDEGYIGPFCVPSQPLLCDFYDSFDNLEVHKNNWLQVIGGTVNSRCGVLVNGSALCFYKDGLRMAVTQDLDAVHVQFIQFTLKYGCRHSTEKNVSHSNSILLQFSNNGGITWNLLKEMRFTEETPPMFFSVLLSTAAKTNSTRFRLWQPIHNGFDTYDWAIDSIVIAGMAVNPNVLYETFEQSVQPDAWLDWPNGKIGSFCNKGEFRHSLEFEPGEGVHGLFTRDLQVSEDTVIQFDIKVGCEKIVHKESPVRLEYSRDFGKTWSLVKDVWDHLHHSEIPSIFYANNFQHWKRIIIPLNNLQICGNVRFRWYQGKFSLKDLPPTWAIDNIYIGPSCVDHCSGHGYCLNGFTCQCDPGFEGSTCSSTQNTPTYIKEDFEEEAIDFQKWETWSGGEVAHSCGNLFTGKSLVFQKNGERLLMTQELDLSQASSVQFYIRLGCGLQPPHPAVPPVLIDFSVNGGIDWETLEEFEFTDTNHQVAFITVELPDWARTSSTRLRWWQPSQMGLFSEDWAIDQIYLGGDVNGLMTLSDDFHSSPGVNWIEVPGSILEPICGSFNNYLHFTGFSEKRYAVTTDVFVMDGSYIQFEISMGCKENSACYDVELQFSLNMGKTWSLLINKCFPSDTSCTEYYMDSKYTSDSNYGIKRITTMLPFSASSKSTRFRWIQNPGLHVSHTWALGSVYIGHECPSMCRGHGKCHLSTCMCDDGWTGQFCEQPKLPLLTTLRDAFTMEPLPNQWLIINGGEISNLCQPKSSDTTLHFYGNCHRQLITNDLDLRGTLFIQFNFQFGCLSKPTSYDHSVLLQYSTNGGIQWKTLYLLHYEQYSTSSFVSINLPPEVQKNGVRIRWWQPLHIGHTQNDWSIDNVLIGGNISSPVFLKDIFNGFFDPVSIWLKTDNILHQSYCGSETNVAVGKSQSFENALLETADIEITGDFVVEFKVSVGCNETWDSLLAPVHFQLSTDFGVHWEYVVSICIPDDPLCNGEATMESVFYSPLLWKRFTFAIPKELKNEIVRFRWIQYSTSEQMVPQRWGLQDVYIGPSCPHYCYGHGICDSKTCLCDKGYSGKYCEESDHHPVFLRDSFNDYKFDSLYWNVFIGATINEPCNILVESFAASLSGKRLSLLETVDLNLQNAKFIHFIASVDGNKNSLECSHFNHLPQSLYFQYSIDGGTSWHLLQELLASKYLKPQKVYILLPNSVRSKNTRFRWWHLPSKNSAVFESLPSWYLDDILIGGSEINPFEMYETFDQSKNVESWWFHPNGEIKKNYCFKGWGDALLWPESLGSFERSITTRELIVDENYMMQFKLAIGCDSSHQICVNNQSIRLEYSKEPGSGNWNLVFQSCFPSNTMDSDCIPYDFHSASIYSGDEFYTWKRVTVILPEETYSSNTQFRWIQDVSSGSRLFLSWSLDDVIIGEACPFACHGNGDCVQGKCHCDNQELDEFCNPKGQSFPSTLTDTFEHDLGPQWQTVIGGSVGFGCGSLAPHGQGNYLYFSGCGKRIAVTQHLDTSKGSKIMFVLRIGSREQLDSCNINTSSPHIINKAVLLQYSTDNGINWKLIAVHDPREFLDARRLIYDIPEFAQRPGTLFRWWQPSHDGINHDQWAIDNIEIISTSRRGYLQQSKSFSRSMFGG